MVFKSLVKHGAPFEFTPYENKAAKLEGLSEAVRAWILSPRFDEYLKGYEYGNENEENDLVLVG